MSLLGILFGRPGPAVTPPPPASPPPTAGSAPVAATDAGAGTGSAASGDSGSSAGGAASGQSPGAAPVATAAPGAAAAAVQAPPTTAGTPVTAPATRHAFTPPDAQPTSEERERAYALENQRKWRVADVVAAISGGPRAQLLIEAASRPGPVQPGSLLEAVKALRPAPSLPEATRTV